MMKTTPLVNNFNAGELDPKLNARSDLSKYYAGCKTLKNMIPQVTGGAMRVPGLYFIVAAKGS